mgnify:CR=1 FL=1
MNLAPRGKRGSVVELIDAMGVAAVVVALFIFALAIVGGREDDRPAAPAAEPEAVAPELPAAASDEFARIDCDSPRVVLGGESELSARIDALFRVKRSPALAAQLNKIYEKHDGIPRYTT